MQPLALMDILAFRSCGFVFGLSASLVRSVLMEPPENSVTSFSSLFFQTSSYQENSYVFLEWGRILAVDEIGEIFHYKGSILPAPGYVFFSDPDWLTGILWDTEPKTLLLNPQFLKRCIS